MLLCTFVFLILKLSLALTAILRLAGIQRPPSLLRLPVGLSIARQCLHNLSIARLFQLALFLRHAVCILTCCAYYCCCCWLRYPPPVGLRCVIALVLLHWFAMNLCLAVIPDGCMDHFLLLFLLVLCRICLLIVLEIWFQCFLVVVALVVVGTVMPFLLTIVLLLLGHRPACLPNCVYSLLLTGMIFFRCYRCRFLASFCWIPLCHRRDLFDFLLL